MILKEATLKIFGAVVAIIIVLSFCANASSVSANNFNLLVYKGAHYPGGDDGNSNDFYFWGYGYGPASTCSKPVFFDVKTGRLVLKFEGVFGSLNVFGRYIVLSNPDVPESSSENGKTYVYNGNKKILSVKDNLVFIDSILWHKVSDKIIYSYSTKTNKLVRKIFLGKEEHIGTNFYNGKIMLIDDKSNKSRVIDLSTGKQILSIPFYTGYWVKGVIRKISKGILYEINLVKFNIERMIKTPCEDKLEVLTTERAFDRVSCSMYDVKTGNLIARLNGLRDWVICGETLVFNTGYSGKMLFGYSIKTGAKLWSFETKGFGELFSYTNKIICIESVGPYTLCINGESGKLLWKSVNNRISYFSTFYKGDYAYDTARSFDTEKPKSYFYCIDMNTGKELWTVDLNGKTVAHTDFSSNSYYIHEYGLAPMKYDLATYKRIW